MYVYTKHGLEEASARQIAHEWIVAGIENPDWRTPDPNDPALTRSYKAIAARDGRVLRVVHRPQGQDVLIVTAHFDRGAKQP